MRIVACKQCKSQTFTIEIRGDCSSCEYNFYYDEDSNWVLDESKRGNRERVTAFEDGECAMGSCNGNGCHMYTCGTCGTHAEFLPLLDY